MPVETESTNAEANSSSNAIQRLQLDQTSDGSIRLNICLPAGSKMTLLVDVTTPDGDTLANHRLTLKNPLPPDAARPAAPLIVGQPALPAQSVLLESALQTENAPSRVPFHFTAAEYIKRLGTNLQSKVKDNIDSLKLWLQNLPQNIVAQVKSFRFSPREWLKSLISAFQPGWQFWLFLAAILVYLLVRLIGLDRFPIYFFSDEAIQTVWAADFLKHGFQGENGELFPTFFPNGGQYNLSISVYLQVIPYLLFGSSVFVNRLVSVLVTLIAAISVGLTSKNIFNSRYPWLSILLLSLTPIWFLHSRTSFETAMATSFFAGMLYYYLMYRTRSPRYIFGTAIMAALCFYTYSPAQVVVTLSVIALFLSDLRYHWQHRKYIPGAVLLGLLLLIPYFRFLSLHAEENARHLQILGSYLVMNNLSVFDKLGIYFSEYMHSLNPLYWFLPNEDGIVRHIMKGYGHLLVWSIPFAILGFLRVLKNIKQPSYRALLIVLLLVPSGAALVGWGPTRLLFLVIPMVLISSMGLESCLNWLQKKRVSYLVLTIATYAVLVFGNIYILSDALINGPTWFQNYGLGGMQYGGSQVSAEIKNILAKDPTTNIVLSHTWANGTDITIRFFLGDPLPITLDSLDGFVYDHHEIKPNTLFIFTPEEFEAAQKSPKFQGIKIEKILPYPNGAAGFIFFRMRYSDQIDKIMAEETAERHRLYSEILRLPDQSLVRVSYPKLDAGKIADIFNDDPDKLIRTSEANPLVLKFEFQRPRLMKSVAVLVGSAATRYTARVWVEGESAPHIFQIEEKASPDNHHMTADFGSELQVSKIELEILSYEESEPAHVHLWEVKFTP